MQTEQMFPRNPPKIEFSTKIIENATRSEEVGRAVFDEIDYVTQYTIGSNNTVIHEVEEWFKILTIQAKNRQIDPQWIPQYRQMYENFKGGKDEPIDGTPLAEWPAISRSRVEEFARLRIRSVEDVAELNEEAITSLGMGTRDLKQKAIDFLANLNSADRKIELLEGELQAQNDKINKLLDHIETLEAKKTTKKKAKKKVAKKKTTKAKEVVEE